MVICQTPAEYRCLLSPVSQGGAAAPPTLGCGVQPLRGKETGSQCELAPRQNRFRNYDRLSLAQPFTFPDWCVGKAIECFTSPVAVSQQNNADERDGGMLSRRQFCVLTLGAGSAGLGMAGLAGSRSQEPQTGEQGSGSSALELVLVSRRSKALGTQVSIDVLHADRDRAEQGISAAFAELSLVERVMSLYVPGSQICRLNREGFLQDPHPYLVDVLQRARAMSTASDGAFDITVQPLWELYAEAKKANRLPDPEVVEAARAKVDWRRVEILPTEIRLRGRGTAITLNGIAQGFAADRAVEALRRHGIRRALVNTGEIAALGTKSHGEPWSVGIQHPRRNEAYVALVPLADRCLATSGDYATPLSADYREHHIFDPRVGHSPATFSSVSVVAPLACEADVLATTVFVLGAERGLTLLRSKPGCEALLVFKDGRVLTTDRFPTSNS
jgi:FAD:protein FMN transferase